MDALPAAGSRDVGHCRRCPGIRDARRRPRPHRTPTNPSTRRKSRRGTPRRTHCTCRPAACLPTSSRRLREGKRARRAERANSATSPRRARVGAPRAKPHRLTGPVEWRRRMMGSSRSPAHQTRPVASAREVGPGVICEHRCRARASRRARSDGEHSSTHRAVVRRVLPQRELVEVQHLHARRTDAEFRGAASRAVFRRNFTW